MSPSPHLHQHTDVYSSALSPTSASGMTGTFGTFVYDKLCDRWPPPTSPSTFSSFSCLLMSTLFSPSSQISPSTLYASPQASAPAAGSLPTAEDVSAQRRCAIPGDWEPARQGGYWQWLEPEWAEQPQEKPQRTFVCHSLCFGVNPRPMGQHTMSCRNNNGRADPYAWARTYTLNLCVRVCSTAYKHKTRQCWFTAVESIMCPATLSVSH